MDLLKSTRHSKITGDFGETLVLYWLSKYGFECAKVDHTGIDLIARNPHTAEVMGISVKSRSRNIGKETEHMRISADNFVKARTACESFKCIPYFAIVVDAGSVIRGFLMPMEHLLHIFPTTESGSSWRMSDNYLQSYYSDPQIKIFELHTKTVSWWKS